MSRLTTLESLTPKDEWLPPRYISKFFSGSLSQERMYFYLCKVYQGNPPDLYLSPLFR